MADSIKINIASGRSKHQRIRDYFFTEIRSGKLVAGQALPSENKLVESLGISRYTIRQVLSELESEGIINRVQGSGTYVSSKQQRNASQQSDVFAFIAPEIRSGLYPSFLHGFQQACATDQHQVMVSYSANDIGKQADLFIQMVEQSVGGIALVPTTTPVTPAHQIRLLHRNNIPVVLCHRTVADVVAPSIVFIGRETGLKAGRQMIAHGHKKIAFVFAQRYSMFDEYAQGLRDALTESGLDPASLVSIEYGSKISLPNVTMEQALVDSLNDVLKNPDHPTAIFCGHMPDAEVVYLQAAKQGLSIPGDLSLVCFGSIWRDHGLAKRISGVAIDECKVGECAAQMLHEMHTGKRAINNDEQIVFPIVEMQGETLGAAKQVR